MQDRPTVPHRRLWTDADGVSHQQRCAMMGAGEISFGVGQNCREVDAKRGHRSGTLGNVPAVLMAIQFEDALSPRSLCEFRS